MSALLCDVGGTNTRFALTHDNRIDLTSHHRFSNDDYTDFASVIRDYLEQIGVQRIDQAVIAVAAVADDDVVELTNRNWKISRSDIIAATGTSRVNFINDFTALAAALGRSENLGLLCVRKGSPMRSGTRLVLGAGTGFNAACLLPGEGNQPSRILTAEAGHAGFSAHSEIETELCDHFRKRYGRCSQDRVLSGSGLRALYELICRRNGSEPVHKESKAICIAADRESIETLSILAKMLGRAAGDLALTFLATGGVFLAGGVTRALLPYIRGDDSPFNEAFLDKGRMGGFMKRFAVDLISKDEAGLKGCLAWTRLADMTLGAHNVAQPSI